MALFSRTVTSLYSFVNVSIFPWHLLIHNVFCNTFFAKYFVVITTFCQITARFALMMLWYIHDICTLYRQLVPLLTNKDISFTVRGRLCGSCVRSSMLHGSDTWPVRKENEVALQQAEMRLVRWMCCIKLQDRIPSKGLRDRLGLDDIISVLQWNRLQWYGHVFRKQDNDWVKKCMEYEVEGARPRGRPKKTWREIVEKDCQARGLNREDAMDRVRRKKQIRNNWWPC